MRRVVVTGLGLVTPLGCGVDVSWQNLIAGRSGIAGIQSFDVTDLSSKIAGVIPRGGGPGDFNQKLKVLPLSWFYGGKEPSDNPFLPRAYEPAQPWPFGPISTYVGRPMRADR